MINETLAYYLANKDKLETNIATRLSSGLSASGKYKNLKSDIYLNIYQYLAQDYDKFTTEANTLLYDWLNLSRKCNPEDVLLFSAPIYRLVFAFDINSSGDVTVARPSGIALSDVIIDWGDGSAVESFEHYPELTHTYPNTTMKTINVYTNGDLKDVTSIEFDYYGWYFISPDLKDSITQTLTDIS